MTQPGAATLTRARLGGIWAGLPTPWTAAGALDDAAFAAAVAEVARWGVAGVYTTGSTGEWYAVTDAEFEVLMGALEAGRRTAAAAGHPIATQAGITATDTAGACRRAVVAVAAGADSVQVALPGWVPLGDDEVVGFLEAVAAAVPGTPIVHYNVARAGRLVDGPLYRRLADAVPALIGAKITGADDGLWAGLRRWAPDLGYLVGETLMPRRMADGARGSCSSYIYYAPRLTIRLYEASRDADGATAEAIRARLVAFEAEAIDPLADEGYVDAAIDKAFADAAGHLPIRAPIRPPYRSVPPARVAGLSRLIRERYPDFLERPTSDPTGDP